MTETAEQLRAQLAEVIMQQDEEFQLLKRLLGVMSKIVTHHSFPPIPTTKFDWCAFYDGEEEAGCYGYGATEEEAIIDFVQNWAEFHDERLDGPDADFLRDRQQDDDMREPT